MRYYNYADEPAIDAITVLFTLSANDNFADNAACPALNVDKFVSAAEQDPVYLRLREAVSRHEPWPKGKGNSLHPYAQLWD